MGVQNDCGCTSADTADTSISLATARMSNARCAASEKTTALVNRSALQLFRQEEELRQSLKDAEDFPFADADEDAIIPPRRGSKGTSWRSDNYCCPSVDMHSESQEVCCFLGRQL